MKTLLLLDDDADFRRLLVPAFEKRGIAVLQAARGAEADEILQRRSPDFAIVDGLLPDVDGPTWIQRLRASGSRLPIAFVSSFWRDMSSYNRLTRELGVQLVLHKPVMPAVVVEEIEAQLRRRDAGGEEEGEESASQDAAPEADARPAPDRAGGPGLLPTPAAAPDADEVLRALRDEYGRALPGKVRELFHAIESSRCHAKDAERAGEARLQAHRLRGTAGSYGFRDVGEAAGRVEDALRRAVASGGVRDWIEVERSLAILWQQAETAALLADSGARGRGVNTGRILVVGADARLHEAAVASGRHQLLDVVACPASADAVLAATARAPDAALIDLPLDEAVELARRLRGLEGCESMQFAFIGPRGGASERIAAAHAGASAYLTRPVAAAALDDAVFRLLSLRNASRPRVLVVDDDEDFARRAAIVLQRHGMAVASLHEPDRVLEALEEHNPELLLLDVLMPGISGYEIGRMLRADPRWQDLPIVMVTAKNGVEARVAAFQAGADDCLGKPIVDQELLARVQVRLDRARLQRDKYDRDALTGLLLRRPFVESLRARLLEAVRHERPLAVALLDLDRFKEINDKRGHLSGDEVLASLGSLLLRRFRGEDLRGRWGGEEFVLAFPGETSQTIQGALSRLLEEFARGEFRAEDGVAFRASFSAGVAAFPEDGQTLEALLRAADRRLYQAKAGGRARVEWRDEGPATAEGERRQAGRRDAELSEVPPALSGALRRSDETGGGAEESRGASTSLLPAAASGAGEGFETDASAATLAVRRRAQPGPDGAT